MEEWSFGVNNDELIKLVLNGTKTATTYLYNEESIPKVGDKSIIKYDNGTNACIIKTKKVIITEFKNITEELAYLEGEDDKTLSSWQKNHIEFFKSIDNNFNENTKIIFEIFELIETLN